MSAELFVPDMPIDQISIGMSQTRTQISQRGIEELADSIAVQGLLEPIVVFKTDGQDTQYEVIAGQRRFLACQKLGHATIKALVREKPTDEFDAKAISLTENLLREDPSQADKIDVCTKLFGHYGSIQIVADKTGIPIRLVREYVKSARLIPEMRALVEQGLDVKIALRAQDAATDEAGNINIEEAVVLGKQFQGMSGAQQATVVKKKAENPDADVDELIEDAKTGGKITQIVVTLSSATHTRLKTFAKNEGTSLDDAAGSLLEGALSSLGLEE